VDLEDPGDRKLGPAAREPVAVEPLDEVAVGV
jgi:hypothetical protein